MGEKVNLLLRSCLAGEVTAVQSLISEGTDVNSADSKGNTCVHYAVDGNQPQVLSLLVNFGADLNLCNANNVSALRRAVDKVFVECVKILVEIGCDVNLQSARGLTALHLAVSKRPLALVNNDSEEIYPENDVKQLIETLINAPKIDFTIRHEEGDNCLELATILNNPFAVEKLIKKCPQLLDTRWNSGHHVLHIAAGFGYDEIVDILLSIGNVDVNVTNDHNIRPLHEAVRHCCTSTIELLVSKNADCNAGNEVNETPLHWVIRNFIQNEPFTRHSKHQNGLINGILSNVALIKCNVHLAIAVFLIKHGNASVFIRNAANQTPLDLLTQESSEPYRLSLKVFFLNVAEERNRQRIEVKTSVTEDKVNFTNKEQESKKRKRRQCTIM